MVHRSPASIPGAPAFLGAARVTSTAVFNSFSAFMGCCFCSDARSYFTGRAALDLLNAGFVTDAARIHRKQ